ncbi:MAG: hypothetical protein ABI679_16605 [Gemmatimonadota bacterium]
MTILSAILFGLTVLLWILMVANVLTLNESDQAGNGLSYAFGVLMILALWVLLTALIVLAITRSTMPGWIKVAAIILLPASCAAALCALNLMRGQTGFVWPAIIPVLVPAIVIGFALWASVPSFRGALSAEAAGGVAWGMILILSLLPWPSAMARNRGATIRRAEIEAQAGRDSIRKSLEKQQENLATFARLTPSSPLWQWMPFTFGGNELRDTALAVARRLPGRQSDAVQLLEDGHWFPLVEIDNLDLEATPRFCELAARHLQKEAESWRTTVPNPPEYKVSVGQMEKYLPAMRWLVEHRCDIDAALVTTETTVRIYPISPERENFLAAVARLRTQKQP